MCPADKQETQSFKSSNLASEKHCFLLLTTDLILRRTHIKSETREDSWAWICVQREWEDWKFAIRGALKWRTARAKAEMLR